MHYTTRVWCSFFYEQKFYHFLINLFIYLFRWGRARNASVSGLHQNPNRNGEEIWWIRFGRNITPNHHKHRYTYYLLFYLFYAFKWSIHLLSVCLSVSIYVFIPLLSNKVYLCMYLFQKWWLVMQNILRNNQGHYNQKLECPVCQP